MAYGLRDAGYVFLLLDDGWTTCLQFNLPPPPQPSRPSPFYRPEHPFISQSPSRPHPTLLRYSGNDTSSSSCSIPGSRDASGRIVPDPAKFPNGHKEWTDYAHNLGLKTGIYSTPHAQTCGGFTGSLGHESANWHAVVSVVQRVSSASVLCNTFRCHTSGGRFNNMDMLTIGKGGMLEGQYRAEVFLCVVKTVFLFSCCARV